MSLLACICKVLVFVEFQSLVDGPGMSFVGRIIWPQASEKCCESIFVRLVLRFKTWFARSHVETLKTGYCHFLVSKNLSKAFMQAQNWIPEYKSFRFDNCFADVGLRNADLSWEGSPIL